MTRLECEPMTTNSASFANVEAVASLVEITKVFLLDAHVQRKVEIQSAERKLFELKQVESTLGEKADSIFVKVTFGIRIAAPDLGAADTGDMQIRATFALTYTLKESNKVTPEMAQAFGEVNGAYNAWPFWREFVYSTMARMGLPPLVMPVFRPDQKAGGPSTDDKVSKGKRPSKRKK